MTRTPWNRLAGIGAVLLAAESLWAETKPSIAALRIDEPLVIDGRLDEEAWQKAAKGGGFRQYDPGRGTPATERTEFAIVYNQDHFYLGIWCYESDPGGVMARSMNRDRVFTGSDFLYIFLDTFHDQRNGYVFAVNPTGAQSDALITNNVERNFSWDGIWTSKTQITEEGWFVEIAIPFKTLSFDPGGTVWGFNISRRIRRKGEAVRWTAWRDEVRTHNAVEAGDVTGLHGMRQGRGVEFSPYTTGRYRDTNSGDGFTGEGGADLRYRITPSFSATVSYNTDFAETEVDQRLVSFSRFPLFFPEKRDFFLEDSGIYNFGSGASSLLPYFSRRIGLSDGMIAPIQLATKLAGRLGDYDVGFTHALLAEQGELDQQNVIAARVSRRVFEQSSVGVIATAGNPSAELANYVGGVDFKFRTNQFAGDKIFAADVNVLGSFSEGAGGGEQGDYAYGVNLYYPNEIWDSELHYLEIGTNFNPALGFVPRRGIRSLEYELGRTWRSQKRSWFRTWETGGAVEMITRTSGELDSARIAFTPIDLELESTDEITLRITHDLDWPRKGFELADVMVPAGQYSWTKARLAVETTSTRPVWVEAALQTGEFYDGWRNVLESEVEWNPSKHFRFNLHYQYNQVDLSGGHFDAHVGSLGMNWNVTPDLGWSALAQYDSISNAVGFNSRIRWEYKPGSTIYFVLNQALLAQDGGPLLEASDLTLKADATFRF
ncbi:MAG: DUF5916 domain-containing protein [Roseibacillus sp.]|nr:DUF5916 domain-containing protein [Roseibacillus sp.]